MFALTLFKTAAPPLSTAHVALVQGVLEQYGIATSNRPPMFMEGHQAVRGWLLDKPTPDQMGALRAVLDPHNVDVVCEAESLPKLKLAVFDLESTCIEQESLDELAKHVGMEAEVAAVTARAMNGEITMHDAFVLRVGMLKGVGKDAIDAVCGQLTGFAEMQKTVQWMRSQGVKCVIVSSGVDVFVRPTALKFGFDDFFCSHIDLHDGVIAGTLKGDIMTRAGKAETTLRLMTEMGLEPREVMAMGDGANDADMMQVVGRPFGWRPKPILSEVTPNQFNHADWRAIRYTLV